MAFRIFEPRASDVVHYANFSEGVYSPHFSVYFDGLFL